MVQPALQDEPRRSRGVWGPSLAENRPKTKKNRVAMFRILYIALQLARSLPARSSPLPDAPKRRETASRTALRASPSQARGAQRPARSAVHGCGCNSCGCNWRLSEGRSTSLRVDLGPDWGPKGPKPTTNRPQTMSTGPRTTSNCSHMSRSHSHRSPTHLCAPDPGREARRGPFDRRSLDVAAIYVTYI